ncbi:hypothetical protein B9G55_04635 [Saccharibacillus sp. O16]|nr:hypothetical protein B9G55_04635 [Saccharibacillus sp. O16]
MGQIAFWNVGRGSGATASLAAIAALIGAEYRIRTLVSQTQAEDAMLERGFAHSIRSVPGGDLMVDAGSGLDALLRLARSGKLDRETVRNHTLPIEPGRLDLLGGLDKNSRIPSEEASEYISRIHQYANHDYDCVLLDTGDGEGAVERQALASADLVVVCLSQNASVLERYFDRGNWPEELQGKKQILLFTGYDSYSKYKAANILRKYGSRVSALTIPYNSAFRDAVNDGDLKGFIARCRGLNRRHDHYAFIAEIRRAAETLLEGIDIHARLKQVDAAKGVS